MSIVFAVYVSASVSGGHLNPAVSIAFCVHKRMQWHYLPGYVLAQCFGAFIGTALCYGLYDEIIADWEKSVCRAISARFFLTHRHVLEPQHEHQHRHRLRF